MTRHQSAAFNDYVKAGIQQNTSTPGQLAFLDTNIERHICEIWGDIEEGGDFVRDCLEIISRLTAMYIHIKHTHNDSFLDQNKLSCGCEQSFLKEVLENCEHILDRLGEEEFKIHTSEWVEADQHVQEDMKSIQHQTTLCRYQQQQQDRPHQNSNEPVQPLDNTKKQQSDEKLNKPEQQQEESNDKNDFVKWGNPPSLQLNGRVCVDSFEMFWNETCKKIFGKHVPGRFAFENIEQIDEGNGSSILVAFVKRPKKLVLMRFVEMIGNLIRGVSASVCNTFDSPSRVSSSLSSFLSPRKQRRSFSSVVQQQQQHSSQQRAQSSSPFLPRKGTRESLFQQQHTQRRHYSWNESPTPHRGRRLDFSTPQHRRRTQQSQWSSNTFDYGAEHRSTNNMLKMEDLERKLDDVMRFLMSRFGFG